MTFPFPLVAPGFLQLVPFPSCLLVYLPYCPHFFLELHAPILEPYFDLAFRQAEGVGDFDPSPTGEVVVEVEFLLKLECLVPGVCLATSTSRTAVRALKQKHENYQSYSNDYLINDGIHCIC